MSDRATVLNALQSVNGYIALGLQIGNLVVPLAKGLISSIKKIGQGEENVSYEIVVLTDLAELDDITRLSTDDLSAINQELTRLGAPTLPMPEAPPEKS